MPYVKRNEAGVIVEGGYEWPQSDATELVAADDAEYLAFLAGPIDQHRATGILKIESLAAAERTKYLTCEKGQEMVYLKKSEQASAYRKAVANGEEIDPADFPFLTSCIGLDGDTIAEVADTILSAASYCAELLARIDKAKRTAKLAVNAASTQAEIDAIIAAIEWEVA